ncbi:MAG: PEP-CTERM sorting domain-containing protein [Sedimentisphaerales bacterium]|nr:PEP-CTERM sorting domain-containing protein [Sedimentisphaerales bacterium]
MKKLIAICLICAIMLSLLNHAQAYWTGFEDLNYGSYSSIVYPWVKFTNNMGNLLVTNDIPGPELSGTHSVLGPVTHDIAERYIANILVPGINFVSVVMGDYDADDDPLYLEAYNATGQLIGSDYKLLAKDIFGGPKLSVSTLEDIAYVHFYSGRPYPGSVFFDNFTAIPEPATIAMLSLGALSLIRRKK